MHVFYIYFFIDIKIVFIPPAVGQNCPFDQSLTKLLTGAWLNSEFLHRAVCCCKFVKHSDRVSQQISRQKYSKEFLNVVVKEGLMLCD